MDLFVPAKLKKYNLFNLLFITVLKYFFISLFPYLYSLTLHLSLSLSLSVGLCLFTSLMWMALCRLKLVSV